MRWVTVSGFKPGAGHLSRYVTSHPGKLSLAIPLWLGAMSTSQTVVTPCGCGVKANMVRVCGGGQVKCDPHCYTRARSERFGDIGLIIKRYINSSLYFTFTLGIP